MVKIKIEDIIFWLIMLFIIIVAFWMLHGSPMDSSAIISIGLAFASSELLLWKKYYETERKTALGFMRIGKDMEKNNIIINNRFDNIENKLNLIIRKK